MLCDHISARAVEEFNRLILTKPKRHLDANAAVGSSTKQRIVYTASQCSELWDMSLVGEKALRWREIQNTGCVQTDFASPPTYS